MLLKWKDVWDSETTFEKTVKWYKAFYETKEVLTKQDLETYISNAKVKGLEWAN
jgi:CDP-glucose 4,6-dehydratase